jgi:hypothetical protein
MKILNKTYFFSSSKLCTFAFLIPIFYIARINPSYANPRIPDGARIKQDQKVVNNQYLTVRREGDSTSIQKLYKGIEKVLTYRDVLGIPASKKNLNFIATLDFVFRESTKWIYSGFRAQTVPTPTPSEYRFPCGVEGGTFTLGWRNAGENQDRACEAGVRVGSRGSSYPNNSFFPLGRTFNSASAKNSFKQAQRTPTDSLVYCAANPKFGSFVADSDVSDSSCQTTIQKCIAENGGSECTLVSMGEWNLNQPELNSELVCSQGPIRRKADGTTISSLLSELTQWAVSQRLVNCAFNVYAPGEQIITPGNGQTLIRGTDTGSGVVIDVLLGTLLIKSINNTLGLPIKAGQRYSIANNTPTAIDPKQIAKSPEVQKFLDPKQSISPNLPPKINEEIAAQIADNRVALGLPPIEPLSSYYLRVNSGSGIIKSSSVAAVSVGTSVNKVSGGYNPSTRELILDIAGRQAVLVLSSPLNNNVTIPFKVSEVRPRISGESSVSQFPKLVKNVLEILGVEGEGKLKKQGNRIQGNFIVKGNSLAGRFFIQGNNSIFEVLSPPKAGTGLVTGTFDINVQIGTSSNLPLKRF